MHSRRSFGRWRGSGMELDRWDLLGDCTGKEGYCEERISCQHKGDYVRYDEHIETLHAKDAEIVRLNEQITEFNRWLSKGVYFTTEEYQQHVEQHNAEIAGLKRRIDQLESREIDVAVLQGDITDLTNANARLRECLQGIIDIGKRDMTNPKYDGYFESAQQALADTEGQKWA
jgi:hypothetical protein